MKIQWFGALALATLFIGLVCADPFYQLLKSLLPTNVKYIAYAPFDGFMILMWCGLSITIVLFAIGALFLLWREYNQALYAKEKKFIIDSLTPATILFTLGILFGIGIYTKLMLPFFIETNIDLNLENYWNLYQVITTGLGLSLMLGFCFLMPILLRGLISIGLLQKEALKKQRVPIIIGLLVLSAVITPTPDILSQLIVSIPLYALFEISILGNSAVATIPVKEKTISRVAITTKTKLRIVQYKSSKKQSRSTSTDVLQVV